MGRWIELDWWYEDGQEMVLLKCSNCGTNIVSFSDEIPKYCNHCEIENDYD